jgi:hypothetical protein
VADAVRYFTDEHISNAVIAGLRRHGVDVLTVAEAGRRTYPDDEQLRYATSLGRVMVSHDQDYLFLAADFQQRAEDHAGIAFADYDKFSQAFGLLIRALLTVHGVYTAADMLNHVEYSKSHQKGRSPR